MDLPCRICPHCGASSEIGENEAVWPSGCVCQACAYSIVTSDGFPVFAPELANTIAGIDPVAFASLAMSEEGNFWFVPRNRLIEKLIAQHFPSAECLMEIGCGTGFVLSGIADMKRWRRLVGSELHPKGLAIARRRLGATAELVQMDARAIPARNAFDVIGAFDVLEHIESDEAVLAAMHGAVRSGGGILLTVPQHPWLWSDIDEEALHVRRYRRGELEQKVEAAGFHVAFSGSYTALLLPLMALSRWTRPAGKASNRPPDLTQSPASNAVLKTLLDLEVTLTLAGVRFPLGGSRVVVAVKDGRK
jgi:SAM-dependent methyltransferase